MNTAAQAAQAYGSAAAHRSQRSQEAEIFRRVVSTLKAARQAGELAQVKALADNRRLWLTIADIMRDPANTLPASLRSSILSVGICVHREMDQAAPDFDFLISVNENIAEGLSAPN
jgi:flagellar biosynthesis regulator FlaF